MHVIFIVTLFFFVMFIVFMAVGVIFANKSIKGSCGGAAAVMTAEGDFTCGVCGQTVDEPVTQANCSNTTQAAP